MAKITISVDGFADAIEKMVKENIEDNDAILTKKIKKACSVSTRYLKQNSPSRGRSKGYAAGWRSRVQGQYPQAIVGTVYQAKKPGLTHLLEKGHAKWLWGRPTGERVNGIPHIADAYEKGKDELIK